MNLRQSLLGSVLLSLALQATFGFASPKSDVQQYVENKRNIEMEMTEAQQCELRTVPEDGGRITPTIAASAMAVFVVTLSVHGGCREDKGEETDLIESED